MEFFRIIDIESTQDWIKENINFKNLDQITETNFVLEKKGDNALIATLWGEFDWSYDKINGGVRFALTSCPNALAWTITTGFPPERNKIILHATINRTQKPQEFIAEVNEFLDDWDQGLVKFFNEGEKN